MDVHVCEERTVKALALLGVLALVGGTMMPLGVQEFKIGWTASTFGLAWSVGQGDAVGAAASAIGAGAAIATLIVCPPAGAAAAALWY
jgi:hypothetical protein